MIAVALGARRCVSVKLWGISKFLCLNNQSTHHAIDIAGPPQPQRFLRTGLVGCTTLRCLGNRAFMNVREDTEIWSLRTELIRDVILESVKRVSGLLLRHRVNDIIFDAHDEILRSLTRAVSYGSRQSYAFLALPLIFDAFTSKVSYACGVL
jgi:hypothetical protein